MTDQATRRQVMDDAKRLRELLSFVHYTHSPSAGKECPVEPRASLWVAIHEIDRIVDLLEGETD